MRLSFNKRLCAFVYFVLFLFCLAILGFKAYQMTFIDYGLEDIGFLPEEATNEVRLEE